MGTAAVLIAAIGSAALMGFLILGPPLWARLGELFKEAVMSNLSFRFGTVGSPLSTPKKPGGSVGGVIHSADLGDALELGWVRVGARLGKDLRRHQGHRR